MRGKTGEVVGPSNKSDAMPETGKYEERTFIVATTSFQAVGHLGIVRV
jgi:hypothetical protein